MSQTDKSKTEKRRSKAKREQELVRKKRRRNEGIGWDGRTLREQLAELEDKTEATGHYAGLSELSLKTEDPIQYEQLYSRLRGDLVTAREISKEVSATPIVEPAALLLATLHRSSPS